MVKRSIEQWVDYIQTLHSREIELSLGRVREVYLRLYPGGVPFTAISVAGTNGKGSTAELLASIYEAEGYRVGKFTSPHLIDFSERFCINGSNVDEPTLINAFDKIETARGTVPITFFEFGTLLAIDLFASAAVDIAVMEVGLGGRLDAVNILDAHVSIITSISIDHTHWLGDSLEGIAHEKVGIARAGCPCVVGIENPPVSIVQHCTEIASPLVHFGQDFTYKFNEAQKNWCWHSSTKSLTMLPLPMGQAGVQLVNASTAIQAIELLNADYPVSGDSIAQGLTKAKMLARCQVLSKKPIIILDVAHNESSVQRLCEFIKSQDFNGKVVAVCGMLKDKEIQASLSVLKTLVDSWNFVTIHNERGARASYLVDQCLGFNTPIDAKIFESAVLAFDSARNDLSKDDLLVVFGSFFVAGDILQYVKSGSACAGKL